jgi:transcriptional regulator with PAS, ATPase and Fis domain
MPMPETLSRLFHQGTIYLAEIGDLSLALAGADRQYLFSLRTGAKQPPPLWYEPRTFGGSKNLANERRFLLSGFAITLRISPLRCRKSEILSIADDLLTQYSKQFDRPKPILREEIIGFLMEHTWPDNLSELQTAIKTFVAIGDQAISLAALKAAAPTMKCNGHSQAFVAERKPRGLLQSRSSAS